MARAPGGSQILSVVGFRMGRHAKPVEFANL